MITLINRRTIFCRLGALAALAFSLPAFAQYSSPIRDVDNPARQPVMFRISPNVPDGFPVGAANTPAVPAGKRLVVETISFGTSLPAGQLGYLDIIPSDIGETSYFIPGVKMLTSGFGDVIGAIGTYRMYVGPGGILTVEFHRGFTSGQTFVIVTISGYYVNLP